MDRVGVRRGPERTASGASKTGGESAVYDAGIQTRMEARTKTANSDEAAVERAMGGLKSKGRKRALERMK